jgi:polyribonucleotide nucleotidyltransferase
VASSDEEGLKKALAMINDLTAVPEVGKVYLGKVVRLAEFGAFVEIFPGTDGLLHISEIAEHRVREVKDELREGDQVMVKVLGVEGNRIKLSRKAVLKEQRQKLGLPDPNAGGPGGDMAASGEGSDRPERSERPPRFERSERSDRSDRPPRPPRPAPVPPEERQPTSNASTIMIEGGEDFDDDHGPPLAEGEEINYNRADGVPVVVTPQGERRPGGPGGGAGGPGGQRRRRRRGRRPGGPGSGGGGGR